MYCWEIPYQIIRYLKKINPIISDFFENFTVFSFKISESTPVSGNNYFFSILIFCGSKSPAFNFSVCGGYVILVTENHQET